MKERLRWIGPAAAVYVDFQQQFRLCVDRRVQSFFLAVDFDLFLMTATRDGAAVGGSICVSASVCVQFQIAP